MVLLLIFVFFSGMVFREIWYSACLRSVYVYGIYVCVYRGRGNIKMDDF